MLQLPPTFIIAIPTFAPLLHIDHILSFFAPSNKCTIILHMVPMILIKLLRLKPINKQTNDYCKKTKDKVNKEEATSEPKIV